MTTSLPRKCPVCLGEKSETLFHQDFSSYSEGSLMDGYDLAVCDVCGAAYANNIPAQEDFDTYYAEMSKYEYGATGGMPSSASEERFRQVVNLVAPTLPSNASIADVGCATGGLLNEFRRHGFEKVLGFDPSPGCAAAARGLYGIEVRTATISALSGIQERFDLVLLTGVLEHIRDVDASLGILLALLKPTGRLYIEVPDATRYHQWFSAPFQFFSMEHVNFFSPPSLSNLLLRHRLRPTFVRRVDRFLSSNAGEPAMSALFEMVDESEVLPRPMHDNETRHALLRYLDQSREQDKRISAVIASLVEGQRPLAVWGAGTHTLRLLKTSPLAEANIAAFIDSNRRYQGKTLQGVRILSPEEFDEPEASVLISSHVAEREIMAQIKDVLCWPNEVICLYAGAPIILPATSEIDS
jgi:SAM-dependent methyltransferase